MCLELVVRSLGMFIAGVAKENDSITAELNTPCNGQPVPTYHAVTMPQPSYLVVLTTRDVDA